MNKLLSAIKTLGVARASLLVGATLVMVILFAVLLTRITTPPMALLYGGMEAKEASAVASRLENMAIPYEVRGDSLYVPQNKVSELRLKVAGEGLVGASNVGYEVFDKTSSFGTTSLVQNLNARRALEGELSRTIMSLPTVNHARVHIVMPKKKLFAREKQKSSASVTLNIGSRIMSDEQIQSITHMVAAATPGLSPENVTIIDTRGNLLSSGNKSQANVMSTQGKIKRQIEQEYENSITRMLEHVVGPNKVNVKVTAVMDFDRIEENSELYDPEKQVVRSEQRTEDTSSAKESTGTQAAGASANIPGQEVGGGSAGSESNQASANEVINYEISKTIRHYVREGGHITKLSAAVLVEGHRIVEDGFEKYVPYPEQDIEKFKKLVQTAIGYSEDRGDTVEIIDMAFAQIEQEDTPEPPMFTKDDYFRLGEYGLTFLAIMLIFFMVIKPIIKAAVPSSEKNEEIELAMSTAGEPIMSPDGNQMTMAQAQAAGVTNIAPVAPAPQVGTIPGESLIDLDKVEGQVKESSIKKVIEILDEFPEESVNVIRSWMAADSPPPSASE